MRTPPLAILSIALVFLAGCAAQTAAVAPPPTAATTATTATERVVIRPVTDSGVPAPGYSVTDDQGIAVDCGGTSFGTQPSPVAVDDDILSCSPTSAYAVACWSDPLPSTVVCYRDPWARELVRMHNGGSFAAATAPSDARPLGLMLSDGDRCLIRTGGAWNDLADHPGWYGTYSCAAGGAVWAEASDGIDQSSPRWTVHLAPISGIGPLTSREVASAYYIGTRKD